MPNPTPQHPSQLESSRLLSVSAQHVLQGPIQTKGIFTGTSPLHQSLQPSQRTWGVWGVLTGAAPDPSAQQQVFLCP